MEVLKNKAYKESTTLSRYSNFPYYYHSVDNKYVSGITAYLDDSTLYSLYTVKQGDTFDNLALEFYNNPTYFWIICSFNHIRNPYKELVPGQTLKIPALSNIQFDIDKRN